MTIPNYGSSPMTLIPLARALYKAISTEIRMYLPEQSSGFFGVKKSRPFRRACRKSTDYSDMSIEMVRLLSNNFNPLVFTNDINAISPGFV